MTGQSRTPTTLPFTLEHGPETDSAHLPGSPVPQTTGYVTKGIFSLHPFLSSPCVKPPPHAQVRQVEVGGEVITADLHRGSGCLPFSGEGKEASLA